MKKLILLFVLVPFVSIAKFYKGTVTMNDGSLKNGFIELPEYPDDAKLKFRVEEKGNNEKLDIDTVKGFEIKNQNGEVIRFITIYAAEQWNKLSIDKKKSWMSIVKEGKINLYRAYSSGSPAMTGVPGSGVSGGSIYYINKPNDNFAIYIDETYGGLTFCGNCFSQMKKTISKIFEKDCPKLANLIEKDDLKKNGYPRIVELYEQNCGN